MTNSTSSVSFEYQADRYCTDLLENSYEGKKVVQLTSCILFLTAAFIVLFIAAIIASETKTWYALAFNLGFGLIYLVVGKKIAKRTALRGLKKNVGHLIGKLITITITSHSIKTNTPDEECEISWTGIDSVDKENNFLRVKLKSNLSILVPGYAFEETGDFDKFCDLAVQYSKSNGNVGQRKNSGVTTNKIWMLAIFVLSLMITAAVSPLPPEAALKRIDAVGDATFFWSTSFSKPNSASYNYSYEVTDEFKERVSPESWLEILANIKSQVGEPLQIKPLAYDYWQDPSKKEIKINLIVFKFGIGELKPEAAGIFFKITGTKDEVYLKTSFFKDGVACWKLAGFDLIRVGETEFLTESFSSKEDYKLFPNEITIPIMANFNQNAEDQ